MSRTIDQKVVEMRFDNSDFERNVSESMSTLDKLKNALNFSGAEKSFSGITSAANKVDFKGLNGAIDGVGEKFSALEKIAEGALRRIGEHITDYVTAQLKSVTIDPIMSGFDKYAQKTNAVQTIMNATEREINDVTDKLATLNWFTDETSYNFTDMVNNIGKFTSQGIELEDAVSAMEGISTAAALAGQKSDSAARVMYNFSQALGMGAVKVQDWMSVENANMATQEFKQTIIDTAIELGRLDKYGNILQKTSSNYTGDAFVNVGNFRSTLAAGWFDSEVLIESMNKFGGFAGRLNEVYDQFNENYDITTSQILRWLDEYEQGTLDIDAVVKKTGLTAEEVIPVLQELTSEEYDLGRRAFAAAQEAKTFSDVVEATKDAVSTAWMNVFENIFGNYEEAKVMWTQLSNELWDIFAGPVNNLNDLLTDWHKMGGRDAFIQSIKNMYHAARSYIDPITEAFKNVFPAATAERLVELTNKFQDFTAGLGLGEREMEKLQERFEKAFGKIRSKLEEAATLVRPIISVLKEVGGIAKFVSDRFFELVGVFSSAALGRSAGFFSGIRNGLNNAADALHDFRISLGQVYGVISDYRNGNLMEWSIVQEFREAHPVIFSVIDGFFKLRDVAAEMGGLIASIFDFSNWDLYFGEAGGGIAGVVNVIYYLLKNVLDTIGNIVYIVSGIDISEQIDDVKKYLHNWEFLFETLQKVGWFDKLKKEFLSVFDSFEARFGSVTSWLKPLKDAIASIVHDFFEGIGMIFGNQNEISLSFLVDGVNGLKSFVEESKVLGFVIETFKTAIVVISDFLKDFLSLSNAVRVFQEAGGGIAGVLAVINDKLGAVGRMIADVVERVTGFDISGVGRTFMLILQLIEQGVLRLADAIARVFGWEDNPFGKAIDDSNAAFTELQAIFAKFEGINISGLSGLGEKIKERLSPLSEVFKGFGDVFSGLWNVIKSVAPVLGDALSFIGILLNKLGDMLKDMSFSDILSLIRTGVMINLAKSVSDMFGGIGGAFESLQKKMKAETIHTIAVSILEIAGAMLIMSMIPSDKVVGAIAGLTVALGGLIGAMAVEFKMSAGADPRAMAAMGVQLLTIGKALIEIAIAMGMMVKPIERMASIENFGTGLERVLTMLGSVTGILIVLGTLNKSGVIAQAALGIKGMASSLMLFFIAIELYAHMDYFNLVTGLQRLVNVILGVGGALALLAGLTALLTKSNKNIDFTALSSGFTKVALALAVFTGIIWGLSKMSWEEVLGGIGKFAVMITVFTGAVVLLALGVSKATKILEPVTESLEKFSAAMWKIGKTVAVIFGVFALFGILAKLLGDEAEGFVDAAVNLIVLTLHAIAERTPDIVADLMTIIVGILKGLNDNIPVIVRLLIEILGNTFHEFKAAMSENEFNFGDLLGGSGLIGGLIALVILLRKVNLKPKDFMRAALVLAGAVLLLVELGALFALIGMGADATGAVDSIKDFEKFASAINDVFAKNGAFSILLGAVVAAIGVFAVFLEKIKKKLDIDEKTLSKNILKSALLIGEVIGLAVLLMTLLGAEMAVLGWAAGWETVIIGGIDRFEKLSEAIGSVFTGAGGAALIALVLAVAAAGVFFEKIKKISGTEGAGELGGNILKSALLIGEVLLAATLLITVFGALAGGLGTAAGAIGVEAISAAIQSFASYCAAVAGFFFSAGGLAFLTLLTSIALIGIFLKKIEKLAGAEGAGELAGNIAKSALIIAELLGLTVGIISVLGAVFAGIGKVIDWAGIDAIKTNLDLFSQYVNAILGIFYTDVTGSDGSVISSEPNGPLIAMFLGLFGVIGAVGAILQMIDAATGKTDAGGKKTSATDGIMKNMLVAVALVGEIMLGAVLIISIMGGLIGAIGGLVTEGFLENIAKFETFVVAIADLFAENGSFSVMFLALAAIIGVLGGLLGALHIDASSIAAGVAEVSLIVAEVLALVAVIIEAMGLIFAAFGGLIELIEKVTGEGSVVSAIETFGEMASAVSRVIGNIIGELVGGIVGGSVDAVLRGLADGLEYFGEHTKSFFETLGELNANGALEGASAFADVILKLTAAQILDGLTKLQRMIGKKDYEDFANQLKEMMPAMNEAMKSVSDVSEKDVENAKGIVEIINVFGNADVPRSGGFIQFIIGEKNFARFGTQLAIFGEKLVEFQNVTGDLDQDVIGKASAAAKTVIELSKYVPRSGSTVLKWLAGEQDFGVFGEQIAAFGKGLMDFQTNAKDVDQDTVDKAAAAGATLTALATSIPDQSDDWLRNLFTGDTSMQTFGENVAAFGSSMADYAKNISPINNWDKIETASQRIGEIVTHAKTIAQMGAITNAMTLSTFGTNLKSLGTSFKGYYEQIKDVDSQKAHLVAESIGKIVAALSQEIPTSDSNWFSILNKDPDYMMKFGQNIYTLSVWLVKFSDEAQKIDYGAMEDLNTSIAPVLSMLSKNVETISGIDDENFMKFGKALNRFAGFYVSYYNRLKDIDPATANALAESITENIVAFLWVDDQQLSDRIDEVSNNVMNGIRFMFGMKKVQDDMTAVTDRLVEYMTTRLAATEVSVSVAKAFSDMVIAAIQNEDLATDLKSSSASMADAIGTGMTEKIEEEPDGMRAKLIEKLREIVHKIEELEEDYVKAGQTLGGAIAKGMLSEEVVKQVSDAGGNFVKGFANGVSKEQDSAVSAVTNVTSAIVKATQAGLQEHSPSKIAEALGKFYDMGLAMGLFKGSDGIKEKVDMITGLINNGTYDGLTDDDILGRIKDAGLDFGSVFGDGIFEWIKSDDMGSITDYIGENFGDGILESLQSGSIDGMFEGLSSEFEFGFDGINDLSYDGGFAALESYDSGYRDYLDSGNLQSTMADTSSVISEAYSGNISSNYENGQMEAMSYGDGIVSGTEAIIPQVEAAGEAVRTAFNKYALLGLGEKFGYLYEEMTNNPDGSTSTSRIYDFDTLKMEQAELESYLLDHFNKLDDIGKLNDATTQAFYGNEKFANFLDWLRRHPEDYGKAELVESSSSMSVTRSAASVSDVQLQNAASEMAQTEAAANNKLMTMLGETNLHLTGIREDISDLSLRVERLERMDVVMDTGTLVGVLTPYIDEDLNNRTVMVGRKVIG